MIQREINIARTFLENILSTFNNYEIEYLVVGSVAVNLHLVNRVTWDIAVWINIDDPNL